MALLQPATASIRARRSLGLGRGGGWTPNSEKSSTAKEFIDHPAAPPQNPSFHLARHNKLVLAERNVDVLKRPLARGV